MDEHLVMHARGGWLRYLLVALEAALWIISIVAIFAGNQLRAWLAAGGVALVVRSLRLRNANRQSRATWQAVHAALLDELQLLAHSEPLSIRPDRLDDLADQLAGVVVDRFEVSWRDEPSMQPDQPIRQAVHAGLLTELRFRVGAEPLTIEPDWLTEYAASLADVTVGGFEVTPRVSGRS